MSVSESNTLYMDKQGPGEKQASGNMEGTKETQATSFCGGQKSECASQGEQEAHSWSMTNISQTVDICGALKGR